MSESMWTFISQVFSFIPDWLWKLLFCFLPLYIFCITFRFFFRFSSISNFSLSVLHLKRRFTNFLCKSNFGFKIAYKLGWAERGVHFFNCGQDCHICPKKDTCDHSCS